MFKPEVKTALGSLAVDTGTRPSHLLTWDEEEDWLPRLFFDLDVMKSYHEAEVKAQKKAMKRR